jgi:hypothetical protein
VAGPRGFEPRVFGFGGLRIVLVGRFDALILSGLRTLFLSSVPLCELSFVVLLFGDVFLGAYERAGLLDFFDLPYVGDDFVEVPQGFGFDAGD